MEDANHGAVRDERRIGLTVENSREFSAIKCFAVSVQAGIFCSPYPPWNMYDLVFLATTSGLGGVSPVMLGDELF